ncbi:MAG: glutamate--tRNA ligase [Elusimicrobia bacterium]|nr:glutamate--tRNA ligase [Elusimicrobiota bacterium]
MVVRVRFAPSPTGFLHIGGARTALFNWLFARRQRGAFILRIEDTDEVRSTDESLAAIVQGLRWLGLDWDEGPEVGGSSGPYFQMQRLGQYRSFIDQLLAKGQAYPCYCTPEELAAMRQTALLEKRPPKYDGRCRRFSSEDRSARDRAGQSSVVRFAMPTEGVTRFHDLVRGDVEFENALLDDFVLLKTSGVPTYNCAVVLDDHAMQITHVIRGDDHLSNTPRQIQLYCALGWEPPQWAHLSMVLGPDGSRLSKRHGATAVIEFKDVGYLPEALVNYLALLGWSTEDSQQLFRLPELIEKFSLERCGKNPAIFDPQKLLWMNGEYIRQVSKEELAKRALPFLQKAGLVSETGDDATQRLVTQAVALEQEKIKRLDEVPHLTEFFFQEEIAYDPAAVNQVLKAQGAEQVLEDLAQRFEAMTDFSEQAFEQVCRQYAKERGIATGKVFHPLRVAVSGRTQGPSLFGLLALLGKSRVVTRLRRARSLILGVRP